VKAVAIGGLILLLVTVGQIHGESFVYPMRNPNERPNTAFPNANGYKVQGFMNEDDHNGVYLANGQEGGEVRSIGRGIVSLRRDTVTSLGWGNVVLIRHDLI